MDKKYTIEKNVTPSMSLREFGFTLDNNEVTLSWEWPIERDVRFALVFQCYEENPTIEKLLNDHHPNEIVVRDLTSRFVVALPEERCKFLICPAYFNDDKTIVICQAEIVTDWIYRKTKIIANVSYKPLPLSQYQKVTLKIEINDREQIDLLSKILTYSIQEQSYNIASYPLDRQIMTKIGHLYIKKNQSIKFKVHPDYTHLFEIQQ